MNFTSHMDAVVTVAVRLVNALTPGQAHGRPYEPPAGAALTAAVSAALRAGHERGHGGPAAGPPPGTGPPGTGPRGEAAGPVVTAAEAAGFRPVAGALRQVFEAHAAGDSDAAARQVNAMLAQTGARPLLRRHDGEDWHLHFPGGQDTLVQGWAAGCATGLAVVLGSGVGWRLGLCSAPRCDRVFVDSSRNGTRRFCSTACQNRVKAAAFRAKGELPAPA
ncbi:MAG TPA: CGNR zinc finger domain-containing protein [Streptosporangiaceae bacterium]